MQRKFQRSPRHAKAQAKLKSEVDFHTLNHHPAIPLVGPSPGAVRSTIMLGSWLLVKPTALFVLVSQAALHFGAK